MSVPSSPRYASVTAAAIVAVLGSALMLLFGLLGLLGVALMDQLPSRPGMTLEEVRVAGFVGVFFIAGLGIWGLVSAIGLFGYRNWARISTLVWSGLTAVFGILLLLFTSTIELPANPDAPPGTEAFIRIFAVLIYGIPVAIAIWWLILFTRKPIVAAFAGSAAAVNAGAPLDASGFPATPPKRRSPLPISIIGWFFIASGALSILFFSLSHSPVLLFGRILRGPAATSFLLLSAAIGIISGLGLLKLRPWSFWLMVAYQLFGLINGTASLLSPNRVALIREIRLRRPSPLPDSFFHGITVMVLLLLAVPLVILLYYRSAFLPSSSASDTATPR